MHIINNTLWNISVFVMYLKKEYSAQVSYCKQYTVEHKCVCDVFEESTLPRYHVAK